MRRFSSVFLVALLGLVVVRHATVEAEWLRVRWLIVAYFLFGIVGFAWRTYRRADTDLWFGLAAIGYALIGLVLSWAVVVQARSHLPETGRAITFGLVFVAFLAFVAVSADGVPFVRRSGAYLAAFAVLLFAIFSHLPAMAAGSGLISYAVQAGFLLGLNLFVLPRYVSRDVFLWAVAGISGIVMAVSLPVYALGEYSVFGQAVRLWGTAFTVPVIGVQFPFLQSIFPNPNSTGMLAFAGVVCAVAATRRTARDTPVGALTALAGVLVVVNGLALFLSYSRASWLATAVALGIYAVGVGFGRDRLPHGVLAVGGSAVLFLLTIYLSVIDIGASGRFVLWGAGLRAILADPSLFGAGMVSSSEAIAPFLEGRFRGYSAHNSYVVMFLRAGLLGGAAYLVLTIGSVADAAATRFDVDASVVALAAGFAVHQLFESYTLFQFGIGSVVGALVVGYLVVDAPSGPALGSRGEGFARTVVDSLYPPERDQPHR